MWKGIALVGAAVALVLIGISCSDYLLEPAQETKREAPAYLPPITPENVLANLQTAYRNKDLTAYAACLHQDFAFIPDPNDKVGFASLDREADLRSTAKMFASVAEIQIELTHGDAVASTLDRPYSDKDGCLMIEVPNVWIRIVTGASEDGEPIACQVDGKQAVFVFKAGGGTQYQIVRQQEL